MRVYSINKTQPRYTQKQNKSVPNLGYMTQSAQSFGFGWLFGGGKVAAKAVEKVEPKASKLADAVIDRIYNIACKKMPKDFEDFSHARVKYLKGHINEETAPFAHALLDQIPEAEFKRSFDVVVGQFSNLVETYKAFPNARKSMQAVVDLHAAHFKGLDDFSVMNLSDILSFRYTGTDMQNRFVEKIAVAKSADGSPRFLGKSFVTSDIFNNYLTESQEEAFNLILDHKSVVKKDVTDYKVLTSMLMDLPVEEYAAKSKHATHQVEVERYLVNGDSDFAGILSLVDVSSIEALKQILPRVKGEHSSVVASILENYTPSHEKILAKGLQLVDRGEMSLSELSRVLNTAGGDVPFRG